jgi:hypothetical protein
VDSQTKKMKVYAVADAELLYVNPTARRALYRPKAGEIPVSGREVTAGKPLHFTLHHEFIMRHLQKRTAAHNNVRAHTLR